MLLSSDALPPGMLITQVLATGMQVDYYQYPKLASRKSNKFLLSVLVAVSLPELKGKISLPTHDQDNLVSLSIEGVENTRHSRPWISGLSPP